MAIMLAADSSYFWSPTPSGAAAVNTFPHRLHRSFSNSYTVAAMGAYPLIRTNTPGSRWRYTLPSQAVSGHAPPAFNDARGTCTCCEQVAQHLFNRPVRPVRLVVLAASRGAPQQHPVRRPVTGPAKPFRIHEGLQKIDRVPIDALPVLRQPLGDAAENVRGQVRHRHPGQNREATVEARKRMGSGKREDL